MRQITTHIVPGDVKENQLFITVTDLPGAGGANHEYEINWPLLVEPVYINFQNGPIQENGINGVTNESLLAIVIDRLECFQAGPFVSDYNEMALYSCKKALGNLQQRTLDRIARGVEGKTEK